MKYSKDIYGKENLKQSPYSQKFSACRIQKNQFNFFSQNQPTFIYEEKQDNIQNSSLNKIRSQTKQNIDDNYSFKENYHQKLNQRNQFQNPKSIKIVYLQSQAQNNKNKILQKLTQNEQEDFTDLWNKIQETEKQKEICFQNNLQKQQLNRLENKSNNQSKLQQQLLLQCQLSNDSSACQLTEEQMQEWIKKCDKVNQNQNKHQNIVGMKQEKVNFQIAELDNKQQKLQQQVSWAQIIKKFEKDNIQQNMDIVNKQKLKLQDFVILDNPIVQIQKKQIKLKKQENQNGLTINFMQYLTQRQEQQKYTEYGPQDYNMENYNIHNQFALKFIHKIQSKERKFQLEKNKIGALQKINWQANQQKKPEIKQLVSKRSCRMNLIQHANDFLIFDHAKFAVEPLREYSHIYLGIKALGNFSTLDLSCSSQNTSNVDIPKKKPIKQYLYLPTTGQCLLQTIYPQINSQFCEANIKKFSINLSLTNEKIAVCERYVYNEQKDKKQVLEVKFYDSFQQSQTHYAGIIQTKISNFSQQWYCDTVIFIPKRKQYSNKINNKNWDKFKIQLSLSQMGIIVAELGIFEAQSSVTNCILFNQNKMSQFMMGTILQSNEEMDYIIRIAGISLLMGFATAVSRKIFVISS